MNAPIDDAYKIRIRNAISVAADELSLEVDFEDGRRDTDVTFVSVSNDRLRAMALATYIIETFPELDIEFIESQSKLSTLQMVFVITKKLDDQEIKDNERRAKLKLLEKQILSGELEA